MSSRFVAAGAEQDSIPADDGWAKARQEVDSVRTAKIESKGKQDDGRSLYEVLEANKAAKQEAFEEAAKLKNQFRTLDDSEVDFLESVHEIERRKDIAVRQETLEQLEIFQKQRAAVEQAALQAAQAQDAVRSVADAKATNLWTSSKKRRRVEEAAEPEPPAKQRKTPISEAENLELKAKSQPVQKGTIAMSVVKEFDRALSSSNQNIPVSQNNSKAGGLGLAAYDSDDDDD